MAEVDPLVLQLRAEMGCYRAELKAATALSENSFNRIDRDVKRLEQQFAKSSSAIGGSLRGLAGSFAAAFSAQQVVGLIDSYTRLQNSLKVAGLEGENLAAVQSRLLELSGRYGVGIEELAGLFGNSSQAAAELGANQEQLLTITEATAQALKITGTSATQAQGAILGLTQALASGTVRAEEFNQINEGGLRQLLQLAANAEQFGGSVAKLRNAVVEGKVSSEQFFNAILQGSGQLEAQAGKATLTLAGAFESLSSQLTVYVGQAAEANGVTNALATAIQTLANNLDTIIPAVAVLATVITGQLVVANVAAQAALTGTAASMGAVGAASFALQARLVGAATGLEAAAFAARGLQAALLGPAGIVLAVTAVALGLGYLATETSEGAVAAKANARAQEISAAATRPAAEAAERLANAHGKARAEALRLARAEQENTKKKLESARASLVLAQAELARAKAFSAAQNQASIGASTPGGGLFIQGTGDTRKANARQGVADAQARIAGLEKGLAAIDAAIKAGAPKPIASVGGDKDKKSKKTKTGPTAAEITERFNSELIALTQQTLSAQASLATSANDRAELELRSVEFARIAAENDIRNSTEYSKARKKRLLDQVAELADYERQRVERDRLAQIEQEERDLAEERFRAGQDALQGQLDLAVTQTERRDLSLQLLDLEFRYREALLQSVIASETVADAEKERARIALEALRANQGARVESARRGTETPGQRFLREVGESGQRINEDFQAVAVDGLQSLNDGLVDAIVNAKSLGQVFSGVAKQIVADLLRIAIQQAVIRPLAESLFGGGGGGGGLGGILSFASLFAGRASGGPVSAGRLYRVNEAAGAGGVELFQPSQNGSIVPLGQARAAMGGGQQAVSGTITVALTEDLDARVAGIAGPISVQVVRQASGPIVEASANEALRRAGRPKL